MIDIDKALRSIAWPSQYPDEKLRDSTRQLVEKEARKKQAAHHTHKLTWAFPAVAAVLAAFALLFTLPPAADEVSYITIDINPSMSMQVNASDTVLSVNAENDDAAVLLRNMTLIGLKFEDALKDVVKAADEQGYLKDNGHVLVASFGENSDVTQQQIEKVISESTQREVKALLLKSSKDVFKQAKAMRQRPGVELLKKQASDQGIQEQDINEIIRQINGVEKGNAPDKTPQAENKENGKPAVSDNPGNNGNGNNGNGNNGNGKNESGQSPQTSGGKDGKDIKENAAPTASKDKPSSNDSSKQGNKEGKSNKENGSETKSKAEKYDSQNKKEK